MKKVYTMGELAVLVPEIEPKRKEKVDVSTLTYVLKYVDLWAKENNLTLFQMFNVEGAGMFFIFDIND